MQSLKWKPKSIGVLMRQEMADKPANSPHSSRDDSRVDLFNDSLAALGTTRPNDFFDGCYSGTATLQTSSRIPL